MRRAGSFSLLLGWTFGFSALCIMGCSGDASVGSSSTQEADPSPVAAQGSPLREVQSWGPRATRTGTPFNRLPNGDSALWIVGTGERQVVVELAGRPLPTVVRDDVVTAAVSQDLVETLLAQPGSYELALTGQAGGLRQQVGHFRVE